MAVDVSILATLQDIDKFLHFSIYLLAACLFCWLIVYPITRLFGGR